MAINVWVAPHGFWDTKMGVQRALLQGFKKGGIKIGGL